MKPPPVTNACLLGQLRFWAQATSACTFATVRSVLGGITMWRAPAAVEGSPGGAAPPPLMATTAVVPPPPPGSGKVWGLLVPPGGVFSFFGPDGPAPGP